MAEVTQVILQNPSYNKKIYLKFINKGSASAVPEMGDRGYNRHGPK